MTVVIGGAGRLGTEFRTLAPDAGFVTRADLDLTRTDAIAPFLRNHAGGPIINCAAYNDVDRADGDPETAHAVNCAAVAEMALVASELGVPLVTYSSDYVFDGASRRPYVESSPRNPLNAYGASKACGEDRALGYPGALVVRTAWLFSGSRTDFLGRVLAAAELGGADVVDDQIGSPTYTADLARWTLAALDAGLTGLLHLTNGGKASRYELAAAAAAAAGIDPRLIRPVPTEDRPGRARRPPFSVLGSERSAELGHAPGDWRDAVDRAVKRLTGGSD